jgi:serine/threonine-protein kinase
MAVADRDDQIADLLLRWEEAWEHGENLPVADLCSECPELMGELEARIQALKEMAWLAKDPTKTDPLAAGSNEQSDVPKILAGRYHLNQRIATGGFGQVWKAFDSQLQRFVAVKLPNTASSGASEVFLSEARKLAALKNPGIVAVHDFGREGDWTFIVSDLIEGENLAERLSSRPFTALEAAALVARVAEHLFYAHQEGFVHRDIKPANILLDRSGEPHIADFGIAVTKHELLERRLASSGTLMYMAPEQLTSEVQLVDHRADIYSLGVVLYQLLTGVLPFEGTTPAVIREQILFRPPRPLRELNRSVPPQLEQICLRCLAKHPGERYATAKELADELQRFTHSPLRRRSVTVRTALWLLAATVIATGLFAALRHFTGRPLTQNPSPEQTAASRRTVSENPTSFVRDGVFVFDGMTRIVTTLERFAPVTLEAWLRTDDFRSDMFLIGSDIPNEYGIGFGVKAGYANVEILKGGFLSQQLLQPGHWCHVAVVYGDTETVLFFNGKNVQTDRPTQALGGTNFVIGNVGEGHTHMFFRGEVRSVRISKGERYHEAFAPSAKFTTSEDTDSSRAVLLYDASSADNHRVVDLSGHGHDGHVERLAFAKPD